MLINLINTLFMVYYWMLIIHILLSWFPVNRYNPAVRFLRDMTEPYLELFRRLIPPIGMVDVSPIVAIFVLDLIRRGVVSLLYRLLGGY
ncbi:MULTISPECIES: YggT family protein [Carboxydocella]|uniref:YggT family protein n=2 Tax=Carboxydocella TaxID=178898 RepID=A0A1T4M9X0_9FIRM|nr:MULTISPECIES: YggT family protein [Carboxydocella]AVX20982.1 YggT family protein [Carboxydocella thermautotrophica]AVX31400.1 YggT family protein [Carboxydocella thermautotrophica]GAW30986.1 YggT family protein [Carboxydocella sp. JDF658]SJZ63646.1 YggT family protein [Carboxydocella sporoproducens DSM 16521]